MISEEERRKHYKRLGEAGFKGDIRFNEPLYLHSTFRLGGPCDIFVVPKNTPDIRSAIRYFARRKIPFAALGAGSNVLFPDFGYRGGIIHIGEAIAEFREADDHIFAEAGMPISRLMRYAILEKYAGYEFLVGIPGTIGGALVGNAGTREEWFNKQVLWIEAVSPEGDPVRFMNPGGTYRTSFFKGKDYVVTGVAMRNEISHGASIRDEMARRMKARLESQPYGKRSAGSVFKNPKGLVAWELIDQVGLRGHREGGAFFSEKHSNFIVCDKGATSEDVLNLITLAEERVAAEKDVKLERELVLLGFNIPQPEPKLQFTEKVETTPEPIKSTEPTEPVESAEPVQPAGSEAGDEVSATDEPLPTVEPQMVNPATRNNSGGQPEPPGEPVADKDE